MQPATQLQDKIKEQKTEFDLLNHQIYCRCLTGLTFREGISKTDAIRYFEIMQEMFNGYFSSPAYAGKKFETVILEHEKSLGKMLDFMIYGIVKRGDNK